MKRLLITCVALLVAMVGLAVPAFAAAPTVSSFTPTSGPLRTQVRITGSNFVAPVTVKFNNVAATSVVVNSSTQVTAQVPGSANSGPIKVTTSGGTATSTTSFTVTPGVYVPTAVGPPGTKVSVYFSGLTAYEAVDVYFDSADLKLVSASATGSGVATLIVPAKASPGEHFISAVGRKSGNSAQAVFTVRTDWPQYANNAEHTGENSSESLLGAGNVKKLSRAWSTAVRTNSNYFYNQAVVAGGVVYVPGVNGVTALSASTGAVVWSRNVGPVIMPPAVSGSILALASNGHLIGLNAATGAVKYDVDLERNFNRPVVIAKGVAYALDADYGNSSTYVVAYDPATGATKWANSLPSGCNAPAVSGTGLYFVCNNGRLYALNTIGGSVLFEKDTTGGIRFTGNPVVTDGIVISAGYIPSSGADKMIALDAVTGDYYWITDTLEAIPGATLVTADGTVVLRGYDASSQYYVTALGTARGTTLWTVPGSSSVAIDMAIANGLVYVPDLASTDVLDLDTGTRVAQIRGGEFAVVTDSGVINGNGFGTAVSRYSLPASVTSATAVERPDAAKLRADRSLKVAS